MQSAYCRSTAFQLTVANAAARRLGVHLGALWLQNLLVLQEGELFWDISTMAPGALNA